MINEHKAMFSIGVAAKMLETTPRTLRLYESDGLITPKRRGKWRYFSMDDIKWIECLQRMIRQQGLSIAAVKKLLQLTPCWNVCECSFDDRKQCTAFMANGLVPRRIDLQQQHKITRIDIAAAA
jgi:MerR family transcriptional regulator/heat shock protein HspR